MRQDLWQTHVVDGQLPQKGKPEIFQNSRRLAFNESEYQATVKDSLSAENEIAFRTAITNYLNLCGQTAGDTRARLREAVKLYRATKGDKRSNAHYQELAPQVRDVRGLTGFAKSGHASHIERLLTAAETDGTPDGVLVTEIVELAEKKGWLGFEAKELADMLGAHGPEKLSHALKEAIAQGKVQYFNNRFYQDPFPPRAPAGTDENPLMKSEAMAPEQRPSNTTIGVSPMAEPVGTRKVWNKRVVQKMDDGRWHVVGHIAGLENPSPVPQLDLSLLDREHLLHLLQQIVRIRHASVKAGFHKAGSK